MEQDWRTRSLEIWIEMDRDRSVSVFAPVKGAIVSLGENRDVLVRLNTMRTVLWPFLRRIRYVVLRSAQYGDIASTVRMTGHAYVQVLAVTRPRDPSDAASVMRVSRLGFASVFPWPKPTPEKLLAMLPKP